MSHPKVSAYIGEYKTCARTDATDMLAHKPDALERVPVSW
jgi:hypothetical protein